MKTITSLIALLMLGISAHARIGETPEECVKRYGTPESYDEESKLFMCRKDGIVVLLAFSNGKCSKIAFGKILGPQKTPELFSEAELETLLAVNGKGWRKISGGPGFNTSWKNSDGSEFASYNPLDGCLIFMTRAQAQAEADAVSAKAKARLKSF